MGDIGEYNERIKQFSCHIGLTHKIMEKIDNEDFKTLVDTEYSIVTGID